MSHEGKIDSSGEFGVAEGNLINNGAKLNQYYSKNPLNFTNGL